MTAPRMRVWEIILDGHDSPVKGVMRVYGTGLMVVAATRADARMQAQARLCQMRPMDVYVRDLEAAMPSRDGDHMIYDDHMISAADLEAFTISRLDPANQREWDLLVMDCEAPGTPFRSTGIKVISWGHAHAFMAANRLLHRLHTDMLTVREIEDESPAEPWSPEQVMRILEVFGELAPRAEQAHAAEKGAAAGEPPRREGLPTCVDPFSIARHYNLRLHPLRDCNLEPWTTPEWEIVAQDVNGQGITFMRGTGIKVPGPSREEALRQAQELLPRLRQDLLDVRPPGAGKAGMPAPWSTTQVDLLFDEYGPTPSKEDS